MGIKTKALKAAFPHTIPIMTGFLFLGASYGIYMNVSGFEFWYPMITSMLIFAGSVEFVTVNLLLGAFNPLQAFLLALMINARHIFTAFPCLINTEVRGLRNFILYTECAMRVFLSIIRQRYRKMWTRAGLCFS